MPDKSRTRTIHDLDASMLEGEEREHGYRHSQLAIVYVALYGPRRHVMGDHPLVANVCVTHAVLGHKDDLLSPTQRRQVERGDIDPEALNQFWQVREEVSHKTIHGRVIPQSESKDIRPRPLHDFSGHDRGRDELSPFCRALHCNVGGDSRVKHHNIVLRLHLYARVATGGI